MKPEMRCRFPSDWQKNFTLEKWKINIDTKKDKNWFVWASRGAFFLLRRVAVIDHFCAGCAALPNEG